MKNGARGFWRGLFDRRCRFYDLRRVPAEKRKTRSEVIQFYSSANNIGNYLPVLGIQEMAGKETDCWCIHDRRIDLRRRGTARFSAMDYNRLHCIDRHRNRDGRHTHSYQGPIVSQLFRATA